MENSILTLRAGSSARAIRHGEVGLYGLQKDGLVVGPALPGAILRLSQGGKLVSHILHVSLAAQVA